ncbi:MAG: sodium-translocating pyrophosphatase [Firmicutes bacterium]|nr:sodium-translocating pyrophosphatase [Bacillota bacterium]
MDFWPLFIVIGAVLLTVGFIVFLIFRIRKQKVEEPKIKEVQGYIKEGAMAFLKREYKILAIIVVGLAILIGVFLNVQDYRLSGLATAVSFVVGAILSALAGFIGMRTATDANGRTAQAAKNSGMKGALGISFAGGTIMGLVVAALGLLGLSSLILIFYAIYGNISVVITVVTGFGLGAGIIGLFARVGGGIYTKAADVGADLVGKVEKGIPEDDPRNPATIADNVGDNVGDVAGMGADLFESLVVSIIATMSLATIGGMVGFSASVVNLVLFPLLIGAGGLVASIIGSLFVRGNKNPSLRLRIGQYVSAGVSALITLGISLILFNNALPFVAVVLGNVVGLAIGQITEYYTSSSYRHIKYMKRMSGTGHATNVLSGLSTGMLSTALPMLVIGAAIIGSYYLAGMYGIALAAVGMLSTVGLTIGVDAFGAISDNAGGLAEMGGLDKSVRKITDELDAVGNTTAAIGKGFAIGSAALTSLALFITFIASFYTITGVDITEALNLANPILIAGLLIGGMLPFLFSSMTIKSVSKAANDMIKEVRRQFKEKPGIMEGTEKPDYAKCVDISTKAALREMIVPGLLAIFAPIAAGIFMGYVGLAGLLAGALVTGILMGLFQSNAGGAWDNTKKSIEADGEKGTDIHTAAVTGDTVGDPFKDTSGPSLNTLIKLMTIVAVVFIPIFALIANGRGILGLF